jgi:hypothetical protein
MAYANKTLKKNSMALVELKSHPIKKLVGKEKSSLKLVLASLVY